MSETYSLEKGAAPVNLDDQFPGLVDSCVVGLGWDPAESSPSYDLDSFIVLLDEGKKVVDTIFFNHKEFSANGKVVIKHNGDDLTGGNSDTGPDETINIKLKDMSANVKHIVPAMNIFKASEKGNQTFGKVNNSFMALYDASDKEVIRHNLAKEFNDFNGVVMADIHKSLSGEWKIKAISKGVNGDINQIAGQIPGMLE